MPLAPGARLGGYEILTLIGRGGMGEVYRARDTRLGRDVAIKILPPDVAGDPDRRGRFEREAQVLASLNNPNIAHIHGIDDSAGMLALVMELVEGVTLADRIGSGPIPLDEALPIARQIADALEAAHEQGIVHRDLKPANIKVRPDGAVKVLDFGLAKALESTVVKPDLSMSPTITTPAMTQAGVILGTAAYMSPEQAKGRPADKRSDIWAFGCVFYEMLSGRRAFEGEDVSETLAAVLRGEPAWDALPHNVPRSVHTILRRCLAKDRSKRLADIAIVKFLLDEEPVQTPVSGGAASTIRTLLSAALLVAITAAVVWLAKPVPAAKAQNPVRFTVTPSNGTRLATGSPYRDFALSPDGLRLAYVVGSGPSDTRLFVRSIGDVDGNAIQNLVSVASPFFSPDSQWIGFFSPATSQLMKVPADGGPASVISPFTGLWGGASWGDDGQIVYGQADGAGLFVVPAAGGIPRALTQPDLKRGEVRHVLPSPLPGGNLLYTAITNAPSPNNRNIMLLDRTTGEQKLLVAGAGQAEYVDAGYLVYGTGGGAAVGDSTAGAMSAVGFDRASSRLIGEPATILTGLLTKTGALTGTSQMFSVSRTGALAYIGREGPDPAQNQSRRNVVWVNRRGEEQPVSQRLAPNAYAYARLSPDGSRIALDIRDQNADIWVWDISRETLTPLTRDPALDTSPVWTTDSKRIIFGSGRDGAVNLFWQAADGSGAAMRLITHPGNQVPHALADNGARVLFTQSGPRTRLDIWALALDGRSQPVSILETPANETNPDVSPDGRWLAYESNESGTDEVYVRPFPNVLSGRTQVSNSGGRSPRWAGSGRELFYLDGQGALMSVAIEIGQTVTLGKPKKVLDAKYFLGGPVITGRTYDVTPAGDRFLMIKDVAPGAQTPSASIVMVLNWSDELKRRIPSK